MKPMTEEEARAAIKEACPWASDGWVFSEPERGGWGATCGWYDDSLSPRQTVEICAYGRTMRSAVDALIRAARKIGAAK